MPWILLLTIGLIVFNLYGLYMRYLLLNLAGTIAILCILYILLQVEGKNTSYWYKLFRAGTYLILLGLAFEAYEGGIRKDPSTYSYYFHCIGTCLHGNDCIFYYVRHLFWFPIDPSIGICRAESDDCIRIHPAGSITFIESGRTGNISFLSGSKCLAGLFTGSHRNFPGFINNHIIY